MPATNGNEPVALPKVTRPAVDVPVPSPEPLGVSLTEGEIWPGGIVGPQGPSGSAGTQGPQGTQSPGAAGQAGAVVAGDAALTINSTSQVTVAASSKFYVKSSSGIIAPVAISSTVLSGIPAATNTRLDQIVVDSNGTVSRLTGTTDAAGITLVNRTGAAAIPSGSQLLHDIVVTSGGVLVANVRDRRPWANGAFNRQLRAVGTAAVVVAASTYVAMDTLTPLSARIECSGVPVRLRVVAASVAQTSGGGFFAAFDMDGVGISGGPKAGDSNATAFEQGNANASNGITFSMEHVFTPAAGSHLFRPIVASGGSGSVDIFAPIIFTVEELIRADANNGTS